MIITTTLFIISVILIVMSIRVMNTRSRYFYRYIVFCMPESINGTLLIVYYFMTDKVSDVFIIVITCIYAYGYVENTRSHSIK